MGFVGGMVFSHQEAQHIRVPTGERDAGVAEQDDHRGYKEHPPQER